MTDIAFLAIGMVVGFVGGFWLRPHLSTAVDRAATLPSGVEQNLNSKIDGLGTIIQVDLRELKTKLDSLLTK